MTRQKLIREFRQSFGNYARDGADDRKTMLDNVLRVDPEKLTMLEPHDFAAMLTCAVYVDPSRLATKTIMYAFDKGKVVDSGILPNTMTYPVKYGHLGSAIATLDTTEEGRKFLQAVVVCLAEAHMIPGLRMRLWNP